MVPVLNNIGTDVACVGVGKHVVFVFVVFHVGLTWSHRIMIWILAFDNSEVLLLSANFRGCLQTSSVSDVDEVVSGLC